MRYSEEERISEEEEGLTEPQFFLEWVDLDSNWEDAFYISSHLQASCSSLCCAVSVPNGTVRQSSCTGVEWGWKGWGNWALEMGM